jgi:hypothetical protein
VFENMLPKSIYLWCLHCERAHLRVDWVSNGAECPKCRTGALDAWAWSKVAKPNDYPDKPEIGMQYPLYPSK